MAKKPVVSQAVTGMAAVAESLHPDSRGEIKWKTFHEAVAQVVPHDHLVVDVASNGNMLLKPVRFVHPALGTRKDYFGYYRQRHPYIPLLRGRSESVVSTSFPFDPKIFYNSEFYQDFFRPLGFRYFAGALMEPEWHGNFVLNRTARSRDFAAEELEFLKLVRSMVIGALRVAGTLQVLEQQARAAELTLGEAGYGVYHWTGGKLEPAHALAVQLAPHLSSPAVSAALAEAVGEIQESASPLAHARRAQDEWELRVAKLGNHRALVLYRNEQILFDARVAAAASAFRLTAREAEVIQQVCRGLSNAAIASRLRVTEDTVKQHLKSVFRKAGSSSRSELIARLNLPALAPSRPLSAEP